MFFLSDLNIFGILKGYNFSKGDLLDNPIKYSSSLLILAESEDTKKPLREWSLKFRYNDDEIKINDSYTVNLGTFLDFINSTLEGQRSENEFLELCFQSSFKRDESHLFLWIIISTILPIGILIVYFIDKKMHTHDSDKIENINYSIDRKSELDSKF